MPKVKISEYSATANSNTDVASINIDEGCAPSGINNAIRAIMGHLKDFQSGTNGDPFNGPVNGTLGATTASTANVTTLTTSSTVTHNGGTANGVAYLNGSKVLTTGSALVFDGANFGVGAGIASTKLGVSFNGNTENGSIFRTTTDASGAVFAYFQQDTNVCGYIARVGTTSAVIYNTTSDYRLKTVTGAVTGQGSRIDALKPVDYQWKEGNTSARGFLAHEFQAVYPNSVTGTKDAVDADGNPKYQGMQAGTAEVIADLVAEIQSLRKRLAALESA